MPDRHRAGRTRSPRPTRPCRPAGRWRTPRAARPGPPAPPAPPCWAALSTSTSTARQRNGRAPALPPRLAWAPRPRSRGP
ncbi:MAG: hypothetical protein EA340_14555 [Nitriliruptor sp.]|nr:MAG: hypothetical protein EA340_14555 [Nitriliruptor sp.]